MHSLYESLRVGGFTESQALAILGSFLAATSTNEGNTQ